MLFHLRKHMTQACFKRNRHFKRVIKQKNIVHWSSVRIVSLLLVLIAPIFLLGLAPPTVLNVKYYGAVGDGITDDSAAVVKALSIAQTNNLTLYFPTGEYNLYNTNLRAYNSISLVGEPNGTSRLINPGYLFCSSDVSISDLQVKDDTGIFVYLQPNAMINVAINRVSYTGDSSNTRFIYCISNVSGNGIENLKITNCDISKTRYGIMLMCPINSGLINANKFNKIGNSDAFQSVSAIELGYPNSDTIYANNVIISNNIISNVAAGYSTTAEARECQGIMLYSDGGCIIRNNYLKDILGGFDTEGIYCKALDVKILDNTLINVGDGDGAIVNKRNSLHNDIIIMGNTIINNIISTKHMNGILVTGQDFTINNNKITMTSGISIYVALVNDALVNGIVDGVIKNNIIKTYGRTSIYLTRTTGQVSISGNQITQNCQSNEKLDSAINLTGTASGAVINITDNNISIANTVLLNMYNCSKSATYNIRGNAFNTNGDLSDLVFGLTGSMLNDVKRNNTINSDTMIPS
jgi:hypothetical protein